MKYTYLIFLLMIAAGTTGQTGNTGIGTTTPGSKLTVNGSLAASYRLETGNTGLIGANDFYVVWNGTSGGTLTLPAAINGPGNYKGRLYFIKNTTTASNLTVAAIGSELIDGAASISLPPGYGVNLVNTGATSGTAWEVVSFMNSSMPQFRTTSAIANSGAITLTGVTPTPALLPGMTLAVNNPTGQSLNYLVNCNIAMDGGLGAPVDAAASMYAHILPALYVDGVATSFQTFIECEPIRSGQEGSSNFIGSINGTVSLTPGNHTIDVRYVVSGFNNMTSLAANQAGSMITATTIY